MIAYESVTRNRIVSANRVEVTDTDLPNSDIVVNPGTAYPLENSPIEHDLERPVIVEEASLGNQTTIFEETTEQNENTTTDCLVEGNTCSALLDVWPDDESITETIPEPNCSDEIPKFSEIIPEPNCSDEVTNFSEIIPEPNCSDEVTNFTEIIPEPNCSDEVTNFTEIIPEPNCSDEIPKFSEIVPEPNCSDEIPKFSEILPEPNCSDEITNFTEIIPEPNCSDEITNFTDIIPEPTCSEETPNSIIPEPNCSDELPSSQQVSAPTCCEEITNSQPILEPDRFDENIYSPHKQGQGYMHISTNSQELPASPDADEITASPQEVNNVTGMHAPLGTPLMVYHFPCDLTFDTQQTGLRQCPKRISLHVPIFTQTTFHYVQWKTGDDDILHLHYKSLNISPPLKFDNSTLQSLDDTYRLLDGQLTTRLALLKQDISHLHTVQKTTLNDCLTYFAFILALLNSVILCFLYGCKRATLSRRPKMFSRTKQTTEHCTTVTEPLTTDETEQELQTMLPTTSTSDTPLSTTMCSTCCKPVSR